MGKSKRTSDTDLRQFYIYAIGVFGLLILLTAAIAYCAAKLSITTAQLLPRERSALPWTAYADTDRQAGGLSRITAFDKTSTFHFNFEVRPGVKFPYISYAVSFTEHSNPRNLADLSNYRFFTLNISCIPANTINLTLYTFEEGVTNPIDFDSYRKSSTYFSCSPTPREVNIDLTRLDAQEWWLAKYNVDYAKRHYDLKKTLSFALHNSPHSPQNVESQVKIDFATFKGRDWRVIYTAVFINAIIWGVFIWWYLQTKTNRLVARLSEKAIQARPLLANQQLPSNEASDRIEHKIMHFIATEYANPDLNLDLVVSKLETNRTKINDVLKSEVGLTFVSHLNKIRLTEASRLLLEDDCSIAEIAYAVGYNNASYFNTLFKKEFGITPKAFQKKMREGQIKVEKA